MNEIDTNRVRQEFSPGGLELKVWGGRVRTLREALHMSQEELADRIDVKGPTISRIESGESGASDANRVAIAWHLGTTVDRLWSYPTRNEMAKYAAVAS